MAKLRSSGKGRGWNLRKGQKDCPTSEIARMGGSVGGKAKVAKGFASREVLDKALETRAKNRQNG